LRNGHGKWRHNPRNLHLDGVSNNSFAIIATYPNDREETSFDCADNFGCRLGTGNNSH
jgi:hypothetical protein